MMNTEELSLAHAALRTVLLRRIRALNNRIQSGRTAAAQMSRHGGMHMMAHCARRHHQDASILYFVSSLVVVTTESIDISDHFALRFCIICAY